MAAHTSTAPPNPMLILETLNAHQHTAALKGAIELEIFTHIAEGATSPAEIARRCHASERGVRILCDYLTIIGFLTKNAGAYGLTPDSAMFLNKRSPAYIGSISGFLASDMLTSNFRDVAAIVRKGGAVHQGLLEPNDPVWVEFARSMASMMGMPAEMIARAVTQPGQPIKVLDIAAGHGIFGIMLAKYNPAAQIVAVDWGNVLDVALENAVKFGVADRYLTIPGSAFEVDLGSGYDVVLLPNFLHHFDPPTNVTLLKKLRAAMKPGAVLATAEFVPNEDRVSPAWSASFSLMMLGGTDGGDAYTFPEIDKMCRDAGFGPSRMQDLQPSPQQLILTTA